MASRAEFRGYDTLLGLFRRLARLGDTPQFRAALLQAKDFLDDDWTTRLLLGQDATGGEVPDKTGVIARRRGRYRGLTGAPAAPRGRESRAIANYRSAWEFTGNRYTYVGKVVGFYPFDRYLNPRFRYYGVSPRARAGVVRIVDQGLLRLVTS